MDNAEINKTNTIKIITMVLGISLALSGLHHGFFEILQGSKFTGSLYIESIGKEFQYWDNGDPAFTLIPNFLITGIAAVCVSITVIIWSAFFIDKQKGVLVFLLLFILLTLVGGGIGHIAFFLPVWGYATRMDKPLKWWRKILPKGLRKVISRIWLPSMIITSLSFITALEISVFGVPGLNDDQAIMNWCNLFLLIAFIFIHITFISGFAYKIENTAE
jgi:hypothetical protein